MECQFCSKECKNKKSLIQHEIRCNLNSNKIKVVSNFISYNEKVKDGEVLKINTNQFTKADNQGLPKPIVSDDTKEKIGKKTKQQIWSQERRDNLSIAMIKATIDYPESYSANNVCGRTKLIEAVDSFGNNTKLNGSWEKIVADYLNINNIKWTNKIKEKIIYNWQNKDRIYYPDFYLPDYDMYIEVKGYQRDRDIQKWNIVKDRLIIIKQKEINLIKQNKYDLDRKLEM